MNRVPAQGMSQRKLITYSNGTTEYVKIENADNATVLGTPINRESMLAIQGFQGNTITFNNDGSIVETNSDGHTLTTTFNNSTGVITQTFVGGTTVTLTTTFGTNSITEVLS